MADRRHCAYCQSPLNSGHRSRQIYCDNDCRIAGQRKVRHCHQCGKLLTKATQQLFCGTQCRGAHDRANPKERVYSFEQRENIARLWREGLSTAKIGERLGISKSAVCGLRQRMNLPTRGSPILYAPLPTTVKSHKSVLLQLGDLDAIRVDAGSDPLPPMHPISWGAIAL